MAEALTIKADSLARVLASKIAIAEATGTSYKEFVAIWDTGATNSVITERVCLALNLKPTGMREVHTAGGKFNQQTYLVDIVLPNRVKILNLKVTAADLPPDSDCLIGMDIITLGDFCVTNLNGKTKMSFRTPSCVSTDYVEEINYQNFKSRQPMNRQQRREQERQKGKSNFSF